MNLIDSNKIKLLISRFSSWSLYILILFIFIELSAGVALKIYRDIQNGATDFSIVYSEAMDELKTVQTNTNLNLYRWYSNLPNFKGKFVITDNSGFRIDPDSVTDDEIIGMFGGSTTFSVLTDQQGTIPNQLSDLLPNKQVLNFGIGGYSSGAEIMTFVEALRLYPGIKTAIFYDGVNELGRAMDRLGENDLLNSYSLIGAPYLEGEKVAFNNYSKSLSINDSNLYYIYNRIFKKIIKGSKINDNEKFLKNIADVYYKNLKIIRAICIEYKVDCMFFWQPSIYTVPDNSLNEKERIILKETPRSEYLRLTEIVFSDQRSKIFNLINLKTAFNDKPSNEQYFYDWCHINSKGNFLVALILAKHINNEQRM